MPLIAPQAAVRNVLIVHDDPAAAGDLRALLQLEGVSAHVLTVDAFGTPDDAEAWMLRLDPIAIVIDILSATGRDHWSRLVGLREAATQHRVPFVMTTRSKQALDAPVGTTSVIEVSTHDDRETLATCIARMVVSPLLRGSSEE
jgi:DNA-binding response OmpR family regulator